VDRNINPVGHYANRLLGRSGDGVTFNFISSQQLVQVLRAFVPVMALRQITALVMNLQQGALEQ